jgi:tetratricopeptide (TPR) repeat protein
MLNIPHVLGLNISHVIGHLGTHKELLTILEQGIQLQPNCEPAYFCQESTLYHLGRWEEAIQSYAALLTVKPESVLAHFRRALIFLYKFEQYSEAVEALDQALCLNPNHDETYRIKGYCL